MKKLWIIIAIVLIVALVVATYYPVIGGSTTDNPETDQQQPVGPDFNADSAFAFCQQQCDFGSRAMNTSGHEQCKEWLIEKFKQYGCKVITQNADLTGYDGTILKATNILAQYRPELTTRILLCAHWDSRPWADNDPDEANWHKPILAANDAASGIAVMLEIARLLSEATSSAPSDSSALSSPTLGIDFLCFDAEDWGTPQWAENQDNSGDTWALGAQYFAKNLPAGYEARYGILLALVGGCGAQFYQERMSLQFAPAIVNKVWKAARAAGYASFFPNEEGGYVTDDHLPLNQHAHIPTIDIISYSPNCPQSSFGPTWHTLADNMQNIDRNTLKAVGQTVVQVLWSEQ